ncbi:MAG TPA: helix-turn-helix domain-containing protein [Noviherbaspirillum sp.]|nr:helix-turn-helix domain-containing protein [Noviherbaspirillum sp.]
MTQILRDFPPDSTLQDTHRHRLLEGMAQAVAVKGYADTTIADIVREAAVSRRTFYEHFPTKADCLIALYEAASRNALNVLREAIDPARDWQDQVEQAMTAYFGCLSQNPVLMRTLFIEILGLGAAGLAARRRVNDEITAFMLKVVNTTRGVRKRKAPLSRDMAMAIVGGINELVLQAIERNRLGRLQELAVPAIQLVRAVTREGDAAAS